MEVLVSQFQPPRYGRVNPDPRETHKKKEFNHPHRSHANSSTQTLSTNPKLSLFCHSFPPWGILPHRLYVCGGFGSVEAYQQDIDYLMRALSAGMDGIGLRARVAPSSASDRAPEACQPKLRQEVRKETDAGVARQADVGVITVIAAFGGERN